MRTESTVASTTYPYTGAHAAPIPGGLAPMVSRIPPAALELDPPAVASTAGLCRRIAAALALVGNLDTERIEAAAKAEEFILHRKPMGSGTSVTLTYTKG